MPAAARIEPPSFCDKGPKKVYAVRINGVQDNLTPRGISPASGSQFVVRVLVFFRLFLPIFCRGVLSLCDPFFRIPCELPPRDFPTSTVSVNSGHEMRSTGHEEILILVLDQVEINWRCREMVLVGV